VIQLDTRFLIRALVPGSAEDRKLRLWIRDRTVVRISALAWTEFMCGPVSPAAIRFAARLLGEPLPFTAAEAALAARLFNESGRRRGTMMDCMIAATAALAGESIATSNPADFASLEKLGVELA
jgi:predicted nucleic acid-binding protein